MFLKEVQKKPTKILGPKDSNDNIGQNLKYGVKKIKLELKRSSQPEKGGKNTCLYREYPPFPPPQDFPATTMLLLYSTNQLFSSTILSGYSTFPFECMFTCILWYLPVVLQVRGYQADQPHRGHPSVLYLLCVPGYLVIRVVPVTMEISIS